MGLYEENKKVYDVEYKKMKEEGYPFHPFATWKDMTLGLVILLLLLGLTMVNGVGLDAPADPTSQYLPRPEWYFMFLFELLKFFPGPSAVLAVAVIPGVFALALLLLPFYDRNPYRSPKRRPVAVTLGVLTILAMFGLTELAYYQDAQDPHAVELRKTSEEKAAEALKAPAGAGFAVAAGKSVSGEEASPGEDVFKTTCAMCHGAQGTNIPNVKLFDKSFIGSRDVVKIVTNGNQANGMQMPSFKGKLSDAQIKAVADYLQKNAK